MEIWKEQLSKAKSYQEKKALIGKMIKNYQSALKLQPTFELEEEALQVIEALGVGIRDKENQIRKISIVALTQIGQAHERKEEALNEAIKDEYYSVRVNAARGLCRIARLRSEIQKSLLVLVQDKNSGVREVLMQALGGLKPSTEVKRALCMGLEDENDWVRVRAIQSLGKISIQDNEVIQKLIAVLKDPYAWVRQAAVEVLTQHNEHEQVIEVLMLAEQDEDSRVQESARLGLEGYKASGIKPPTFFSRLEPNTNDELQTDQSSMSQQL